MEFFLISLFYFDFYSNEIEHLVLHLITYSSFLFSNWLCIFFVHSPSGLFVLFFFFLYPLMHTLCILEICIFHLDSSISLLLSLFSLLHFYCFSDTFVSHKIVIIYGVKCADLSLYDFIA